MNRRVLFIRDDGALGAELDRFTNELRTTHRNITTAHAARQLLWAALRNPSTRRQAAVRRNRLASGLGF